MNCKNFILCITLGAATMSVHAKVKKTETQATPTSIYWTDGYGRVTYSTCANLSPVAKVALGMFASDMKSVTGMEPKSKSASAIQIYQLDLLSNKEFSAVEKLGVPLHRIITAKDAFYIGTRKGKVIVVGSNGRGTAYAILQLSHMAGISPWTGWNDLQPPTRSILSTPVGQEWIEIPNMEFRGLAVNGSKWMSHKNYSQIARLMLRLRANTLWIAEGKRHADIDKAVVDSFDICMADNYKVTELMGKKRKKHKKTIESVKMVGGHLEGMENLSPGMLGVMLNDPFYTEEKGRHHKDAECNAWIANITNPKKTALQLSMMMDMAWNPNALAAGCKSYLIDWLGKQFGASTAKQIYPLMEQYYRLTSIRKPAFMSMPYDDTEFHSGEFGNELERYLYAYDKLKTQTEKIERTLPVNQRDGFFEIVKYPIFSAAFVAEKELEAQEARDIARPGLFNKDNEAKAAAAVSLTAYEKLRQLNAYYGRIAGGRWKDFISTRDTEMQPPSLPGTLTAKEITSLRKEAFDRNTDLKPLALTTGDIIAKNAYEWTKATESPMAQAAVKGAGKISLLPLLGHSNKAVKLPKGSTLSYSFFSSNSGDARFTIAAIPNYSARQSMQVSVSIDHATPVVCQLFETPGSKQWQFNLWRGQALKSFYVTLPSGNHTVEIKSLDDSVIIDQWVLDYDVDREYYVIPVLR